MNFVLRSIFSSESIVSHGSRRKRVRPNEFMWIKASVISRSKTNVVHPFRRAVSRQPNRLHVFVIGAICFQVKTSLPKRPRPRSMLGIGLFIRPSPATSAGRLAGCRRKSIRAFETDRGAAAQHNREKREPTQVALLAERVEESYLATNRLCPSDSVRYATSIIDGKSPFGHRMNG